MMTSEHDNPFADEPMTREEHAAYLLASAVHVGIRNPQTGGPRGQMITWVDTWWPQSNRAVEALRDEGNRGVLEFDRERREGMYE